MPTSRVSSNNNDDNVQYICNRIICLISTLKGGMAGGKQSTLVIMTLRNFANALKHGTLITNRVMNASC